MQTLIVFKKIRFASAAINFYLFFQFFTPFMLLLS